MDFEGLDNHDNPHPQGGEAGSDISNHWFYNEFDSAGQSHAHRRDPLPQGGAGWMTAFENH